MLDVPSTRVEKLVEAREIGLKAGLKFVYVGNVLNPKGESTFCPKCGKLLIERSGYSTKIIGLDKGKCVYCGEKIPGVWK
jgi:pyruvate formate lyase activating enzyme